MKSFFYSKAITCTAFLAGLFFTCYSANAQICADPSNTVYGLTPSATVHAITVNTATSGANLTPAYAGNAPSVANAIGYNSNSGKFYYFKRNSSAAPQEFVVFDPGLMTITIKASCPTVNDIHCGCITANGLGYYAMDVNANLYYYNIFLNTWTTIGNNFKDQFNNNVTTVFSTHNSGDMAIDGNGNLWILCSSFGEYGLYRLNGSLPTTPQLQMTVTRFIVPTTPTPAGDAFAGIAFNTTGQIIMSMYVSNKLYRMENNYSLTFLGTMSVNNVGNDLTSCSYPLGVLPVRWEQFTANVTGDLNVELNLKVSSERNNAVFYIEHSVDGKDWNTIATIQSTVDMGNTDNLSYTHIQPSEGMHQYRIKELSSSGHADYSDVRAVIVKKGKQFLVWPNPVKDLIYLQTPSSDFAKSAIVRIYDRSGALIRKEILNAGKNYLDLKNIKAGFYVVNLESASGETFIQKIIKQ
jgi:hypothetical protein